MSVTSALSAKDRGPFPGSEDKWDYYTSPHFELYSRNGDMTSRDLLRNLELLRAAFIDTFKLVERRPIPVTIYYFSRDSEMAPYKPESHRKNDELAGYYLPWPDRAVIVMSAEHGDAGLRGIIFHEYIHHLFRVSEQEPPLWYNEGMAELFSTIEVKMESLSFGKPRPDHVYELQNERLLPLEVLFGVDHASPIYNSGQHTGVFYAESWALMHYLHFGRTDIPKERRDAFLDYVQAQNEKTDAAAMRQVFRQTLQMDYADMVGRLESYVQNGKYGWGKLPIPAIPGRETYAKRSARPDEIREQLAGLLLRINRAPAGKLALLHALDANPNNIRALETLGMNCVIEEDENGARDRWERAIAAGSDNPAIFHELGMIESRRWFREFDYYFRMQPAKTEQLRQLLLRSIDYAPRQSAAYEMLAWVESTAREPSIENVNIVQRKFGTLKDKPRTLLALVMVRIRMNDLDTARNLLNALASMPVDPANAGTMARSISFLQARLDNRPTESEAETAPEPVEVAVPVTAPRGGSSE